MRIIGRAPDLCPLPLYDIMPMPCIIYMTMATKNMRRIMQAITYPAVVVVSDARFLIVMINTTSAIINKKMNSYIFDRRINIEYSLCAVNVSLGYSESKS